MINILRCSSIVESSGRPLVAIIWLFTLVAACTPVNSLDQRSLAPADAEDTDTTVVIVTPTAESAPQVESTPTAETASTDTASADTASTDTASTDTASTDTASTDTASTDMAHSAAIDITISLPDGEPQNGEELLTAKACAGCHLLGAIGAGPSWKAEIYAGGKGIATRAQERWQHDGYTGQATNATEYLVESILMPNEYVIEGYSQGTMPNTYRELLTDQELADLIAFLLQIQ